MPPNRLPSVRQQRLGIELRKLRESADMSATAAGCLLAGTQSQISNIEAGRYPVSADRVRVLARNYGCVDDALVNALANMTGGRTRGWWEEYRDFVPSPLLDLAELEHHAVGLRVAQIINVPGLLQTMEHARALFREDVPRPPAHVVEHLASYRVKRQAVLYGDPPPPYTAIIHEAALRMRLGGESVARNQLQHIIEMSEMANVTIRVIQFGSTAFPAAGPGIDYLYGPVHQLDTVQLDTDHGSTLVHNASRLARYRLILDRMESAALDPDDSVSFVKHLIQGI